MKSVSDPQHSGGDFESRSLLLFHHTKRGHLMVLDGSQENPQMPFWDVLAERRCIKAITLTDSSMKF